MMGSDPLTPSPRSCDDRSDLLLACGVLALIVSALLSSPVSSRPRPPPVRSINGVGSGRCLDVLGVSKQAGTGLDVWDCNNQINQGWSYTSAGELKIYDTSTCLDVESFAVTAPARVQIWPCNGGANQKWSLNPNGTITGVQSGLCLDVKGKATAAGSSVQLWTCNGGSNQQWTTALRATDTTPPSVPASAEGLRPDCSSVHFGWSARHRQRGCCRLRRLPRRSADQYGRRHDAFD